MSTTRTFGLGGLVGRGRGGLSGSPFLFGALVEHRAKTGAIRETATMELADRISEMVRPTVEALGYSLVRVQVSGRQRPRLQVMAESDRRATDDGRRLRLLESRVVRRSRCRGSDFDDLYAGGQFSGNRPAAGASSPIMIGLPASRRGSSWCGWSEAGDGSAAGCSGRRARRSGSTWTVPRSRCSYARHPARQTGADRRLVGRMHIRA